MKNINNDNNNYQNYFNYNTVSKSSEYPIINPISIIDEPSQKQMDNGINENTGMIYKRYKINQ